jgi:hypothetical protein
VSFVASASPPLSCCLSLASPFISSPLHLVAPFIALPCLPRLCHVAPQCVTPFVMSAPLNISPLSSLMAGAAVPPRAPHRTPTGVFTFGRFCLSTSSSAPAPTSRKDGNIRCRLPGPSLFLPSCNSRNRLRHHHRHSGQHYHQCPTAAAHSASQLHQRLPPFLPLLDTSRVARSICHARTLRVVSSRGITSRILSRAI